ncbi:MAG: TIGR03088 family PEP-CTERM/XrtA system glycosyltransferase [Gammaproteobacteria bacterium]|nr:TIGR03088 family PEP-CTERM/XrtA system glycosyltransferase [Gammaproteobacteria bacterium]
MQGRPLIVHVLYRLAIGGLENGLINLINRMPEDCYRHVIICASDYTDFRKRIQRDDVEVYALHKRPGNDIRAQYRFWKLMRKLKPQIVHTRNLGTIEYTLPAAFAGVKYRIHGEHGRDMSDIDGSNSKYRILRRAYNPLIARFIALSKDLDSWLKEQVRISPRKIVQIYNGVDMQRFSQSEKSRQEIRKELGIGKSEILVGSVGRLQAEKDQATLLRAYALLEKNENTRLVLIGDGPDRQKLEALAIQLAISNRVIFAGARNDVPAMLNALDLFVLPSLGEGISNTILEAMASGLPIVATSVGGNPELIDDGNTGLLVPSNNPSAMTAAIDSYLKDKALLKQHGKAGRARVERLFSMDAMIANYMKVYDELCGRGS